MKRLLVLLALVLSVFAAHAGGVAGSTPVAHAAPCGSGYFYTLAQRQGITGQSTYDHNLTFGLVNGGMATSTSDHVLVATSIHNNATPGSQQERYVEMGIVVGATIPGQYPGTPTFLQTPHYFTRVVDRTASPDVDVHTNITSVFPNWDTTYRFRFVMSKNASNVWSANAYINGSWYAGQTLGTFPSGGLQKVLTFTEALNYDGVCDRVDSLMDILNWHPTLYTVSPTGSGYGLCVNLDTSGYPRRLEGYGPMSEVTRKFWASCSNGIYT